MKSKRTKATSIPYRVKKAVWDRQMGMSLVSGKAISISECCCHYIPRSKGGLGIEENIIGLTHEEHMVFDNNLPGSHKYESQMIGAVAKKHLQASYDDWSEDKLVYRKFRR